MASLTAYLRGLIIRYNNVCCTMICYHRLSSYEVISLLLPLHHQSLDYCVLDYCNVKAFS